MKLIFPIISMCALAVTTHASFDLARSRPPVAMPQPKNVTVHADPRVDNYFWLREKENPAVINYLERENAYTEAVLAPATNLRANLYQELIGRIQEDDTSAPVSWLGYSYYTRTEKI